MKTDTDSKTVAEATSSCEVRTCPRCGNAVTDPLVTRCPRCWGALPGMSCGSCRGCPMGKG